jgi:hypothetical protein
MRRRVPLAFPPVNDDWSLWRAGRCVHSTRRRAVHCVDARDRLKISSSTRDGYVQRGTELVPARPPWAGRRESGGLRSEPGRVRQEPFRREQSQPLCSSWLTLQSAPVLRRTRRPASTAVTTAPIVNLLSALPRNAPPPLAATVVDTCGRSNVRRLS